MLNDSSDIAPDPQSLAQTNITSSKFISRSYSRNETLNSTDPPSRIVVDAPQKILNEDVVLQLGVITSISGNNYNILLESGAIVSVIPDTIPLQRTIPIGTNVVVFKDTTTQFFTAGMGEYESITEKSKEALLDSTEIPTRLDEIITTTPYAERTWDIIGSEPQEEIPRFALYEMRRWYVWIIKHIAWIQGMFGEGPYPPMDLIYKNALIRTFFGILMKAHCELFGVLNSYPSYVYQVDAPTATDPVKVWYGVRFYYDGTTGW